MPKLSAASVAEICGGRLIGDGTKTAGYVVADSRAVDPGTAFVAVAGGHAFVREAHEAGAPFVIVDRRDAIAECAIASVIVDDTVRALGALATAVRRDMALRVVGITGSTGKTLTKDLVATTLAVRYRVHAAPKSYNNEIGVPLVVLSCPDDINVMVVEVAARHAGEIAELCEIVRPQMGIVTGIGNTHLEEFGSRDAIARTKAELLAALPAEGVAIVPSDDEYLALLSTSTGARLRTVGPGAAVSYRATAIDPDGRTHGIVSIAGRDVTVTIPIAGRALLRNVALAIAAGIEHGVDPDEAAQAIASAQLSSFRMEIVDVPPWTIVNDAYNANPTSVASALRSVKEMADGRPVWAILGPMAELGPASEREHVRIGRLASDLRYDGVIALGDEGAEIARGAGPIASRVATAEEAADALNSTVPAGAIVLVKASRVVSLERFPDILRARPDRVGRIRQTGAPGDRKA